MCGIFGYAGERGEVAHRVLDGLPSDETESDMLASASQVKARGATVIGIAPRRHSVFDHHIEVADLGDATSLVGAVPAQLLGYDLARLRGHDPDMPRNLAKSVTVK
jgi:glucosamine--fructose-6-phosphate aminotransferase (isomerizing)